MTESANKPVSNKICILYDSHDGRVVHTHQVLTMPGAQTVTDEEVEERARDRAKRAGHDVGSRLSALRVSAEDYEVSSQYRVDLVTKKLEKLERPPAPR